MNIDPPFRYITMDSLVLLFQHLIKKEKRKLTAEEVIQYKGYYQIAIKNLEEILKEGLLQRKPLELFYKEAIKCKEYLSQQEVKHEQIASDAGLLLDSQANQKSKISEHIKLPENNKEIVRASVWSFMIAKHNYEKLLKVEESLELIQPSKEEEKFILDSIPPAYSDSLIKCKQVIPNQLIDRYIFQNDKFFLIIEADTKKIVKQSLMNDICIATDISNPKRMNLTMTNENKAENISLLFEDDIVPISIKSYIEECVQRIISEQISKIYEYLELSKTKLKEDPCNNTK